MRIIKDHIDDCQALKLVACGDWDTPWWISSSKEYRRSNGYAGGSRCGLLIECNSSDCDAKIWVSEDDVLAALNLTNNVF